MNAYTSFAQVYDAFMDNVPYEEGCHNRYYVKQVIMVRNLPKLA